MKKVKIILYIIIIILISVFIYLFAFYKTKFEIPKFDKNAKTYEKIEKIEPIEIDKNYLVYIDGNMKAKKDNLFVYVASDKENKVYFKVRIYQDEEIIGESGLLKAGQYIDKIKITKKIKGTITLKIMGYNMKTYRSAGKALFEVKVNKK